jgi:predicted type IV restriction endonuclease
MNLKDHILDVQQGIRTGRFLNEASVSQGIVLRLLQALGWPTYDTQIVSPEYTVSGTRVDYALCHPRSKPIVFI